jgi:uncharacterized OsmC-like protein
VARCKHAEIALDADPAGAGDALNPAKLLLAALSACIVKGIERVTPILRLLLRGLAVHGHGVRHEAPPTIAPIAYEIVVGSDESERHLELLHECQA